MNRTQYDAKAAELARTLNDAPHPPDVETVMLACYGERPAVEPHMMLGVVRVKVAYDSTAQRDVYVAEFPATVSLTNGHQTKFADAASCYVGCTNSGHDRNDATLVKLLNLRKGFGHFSQIFDDEIKAILDHAMPGWHGHTEQIQLAAIGAIRNMSLDYMSGERQRAREANANDALRTQEPCAEVASPANAELMLITTALEWDHADRNDHWANPHDRENAQLRLKEATGKLRTAVATVLEMRSLARQVAEVRDDG